MLRAEQRADVHAWLSEQQIDDMAKRAVHGSRITDEPDPVAAEASRFKKASRTKRDRHARIIP